MYHRSPNKEDPWISLKDHFTASKEGLIVYGENSYGGHLKAISAHDGADVYIRMAVKDGEEEEKCDTTPVQVNYLGDSYCTSSNKCDIGEGDCDRDSDCKTGLKCGQRNSFENLPGLTGFEKFEGKKGAKNGSDKNGNGDYCYDPNFYQKAAEADPKWFDTTPVQVNYLGDSACTSGKPCSIGEGDCDRDTDCKHGLKCGQRNGFEGLPGLTGFEKFQGKKGAKNGSDKNGNGDYCYDPEYTAKAIAVRNAKVGILFDPTPV
jgi:hypothetical protein